MVGGMEVEGFSGWGVGLTTSGGEDEGGCEGFGCASGGVGWFDGGGGGEGGFDDGGVGDGVGVWTGVEGLAGVCCELWSEEISSSGSVVGRSSGLSGSVIDFDAPITSPCWSQVNIIVTVA